MVSYRPVMMTGARQRPTSRAPVARLAAALAAALLVAGLPVRQAPAAQAVAVGDVTVTGNGDEALAEAMRTTLVRVTGRRAAGNDPALS